MSMFGCYCRRGCTGAAVVTGVIVGVLAAFLQIAGVFTLGTVFLWVALGVALVYLAVLTVAAALVRALGQCHEACCRPLTAALVAILATAVLALVLLAVGIIATSVVSAILVGLLLAAFTVILTGTACYVRCLADCGA